MRISTHILDTARGTPAANVGVQLERQDASGAWRTLSSSRTGADGRCAQLLPEGEKLVPGAHRLTFDTAAYYSAQGASGLYPVVQITFTAREGDAHFHIPLLLSPHGYTTYRGS